MNKKELDETLQHFYVEARNKKGEIYSRSSLINLRYAIERYLNDPPYERGIKIAKKPGIHQLQPSPRCTAQDHATTRQRKYKAQACN